MTTFAGWQLVVQWKTGSSYKTLDGIQRISYDFVNNVEAKEECGSRYPTYLVEGIYGTTGTLERFYTGSGVWAEFQGAGGGNAALPIIDIQINPNGTASGQPYIRLGGVKLDKNSVSHRPGSNLMSESWSFTGTGSLTIGTN
jgi:hypothetical protein